jgi:hypothetical protein
LAGCLSSRDGGLPAVLFGDAMKSIVVGVSVSDYDMTKEGGQKGTSAKVSVVKGRPSLGRGWVGSEAGVYKLESTEVGNQFIEEFKRIGPFVADLDMDVKGTGENKQAVIIAAEILGPLAEFEFTPTGLQFKSARIQPARVSSGAQPAVAGVNGTK